MRRLAGSIAVHGVLLALLLAHGRDGGRRGPRRSAVTVEVIALPQPSADLERLPLPASQVPAPAGGDVPHAAAQAASRARLSTAPPSARAQRHSVAARAAGAAADPRGRMTFEDGPPRTIPSVADGEVADPQSGAGVRSPGTGNGTGSGIGFGDGGGVTRGEAVPSPPPAPRASKARSALLIYPTRQRDADDAELFIARVVIDADGDVVGAHVVRGFGGPRDELASALIWKFHYAPALDDDGRAIRSTLDQRFLVGR